MSITLKQLYDQTKSQFKLSVLAAESCMNREVSRLYYMEDTKVSGWTRDGELIITMLMSYHTEQEILQFIDSFLPYDPPGIMINVGGYINVIPQSVIDHCEQLQIPLLIFPWEIYLQDIMQTFTNLIFESQQKEYSSSSLFLRAVFDYDPSLSDALFPYSSPYIVVVLDQSDLSDVEYHFLRSELLKIDIPPVFCPKNDHLILIFSGYNETDVQSILLSFSEKCMTAFPKKIFHIGIGSISSDLSCLKQGYDQACLCEKLCFQKQNEVKSFQHLGIWGILATSNPALLRNFCKEMLDPLARYDKENHSNYVDTLKSYILSNGNTTKISESLFIHRNTVNYRLKKIRELFDIDLNNLATISDFQIAFNILYLFEHTKI